FSIDSRPTPLENGLLPASCVSEPDSTDQYSNSISSASARPVRVHTSSPMTYPLAAVSTRRMTNQTVARSAVGMNVDRYAFVGNVLPEMSTLAEMLQSSRNSPSPVGDGCQFRP